MLCTTCTRRAPAHTQTPVHKLNFPPSPAVQPPHPARSPSLPFIISPLKLSLSGSLLTSALPFSPLSFCLCFPSPSSTAPPTGTPTRARGHTFIFYTVFLLYLFSLEVLRYTNTYQNIYLCLNKGDFCVI